MAAANSGADFPDGADRIYARRAAIAELRSVKAPPVGTHDIVRFLTCPDAALSHAHQQQLLASPRLQSDFRALRRRYEALPVPRLAAASSDASYVRQFPGGSIRIVASRHPRQFYLVLQLSVSATYPRALLLEGDAGDMLKRALPEPDENGEVLVLCDTQRAEDAKLVELIQNPAASGSFLI
jgi:hypothetical protein